MFFDLPPQKNESSFKLSFLAYKIEKRKEKTIPRKCYTLEQIINFLREAEVLISQGSTAKEAVRYLGYPNRPTTDGGKNTQVCSGSSQGQV